MKKKNLIVRLFLEAKPIWHWLILGALISMISVICAVAIPDILGDLIQKLYDYWQAGSTGSIVAAIIPALCVLAAVYLIGALTDYFNMLLMNKVVSRYYTCGLRIRISEKIKHLPVRYVDQTPVGDILSRMTDDVGEMGGYMHQIFDVLVKGFFQIVLIAAVMFCENWKLAALVVVLTPLSVFLSAKIASATEKYYDEMFQQNGKLSEVVEETFSNYPTIKAYHLEEFSAEKHQVENQKLRRSTSRANFIGSVVQPLIRFSNALAYVFIALMGGYLIVNQGVSVGVVVAIILYARQFASPLEELAYGFGRMNLVKAAAQRVFDILDMEEEQDKTGALNCDFAGKIDFNGVDFSYTQEQPLIEHLSFSVQPGQKIAIVGPTGAGKTTIVNLLMRFYDPVSGCICLDGVDTATVPKEEIRSRFGMVLQDTWLFRGTIYENVAYGRPDATRQDVEDACRKTFCDQFIRTMPDGYDTVIGEDTTNLSGGQKQLLTIARALLADRPLLILDEATSNVDTRTELLIQKAMDQLMEGKTCFVIAHRLSTIVNSDLILVLNQGKIVEQGTHKALLESKGFYYEMYKSQYAV